MEREREKGRKREKACCIGFLKAAAAHVCFPRAACLGREQSAALHVAPIAAQPRRARSALRSAHYGSYDVLCRCNTTDEVFVCRHITSYLADAVVLR